MIGNFKLLMEFKHEHCIQYTMLHKHVHVHVQCTCAVYMLYMYEWEYGSR